MTIRRNGANRSSGSRSARRRRRAGAVALAEFAHSIAAHYDVNIALHTDHCPKDKLPGYMEPLLKISQERVAKGLPPLFQSHMWDGSAVPLEEDLDVAEELLDKCHRANIIMELEIGVVGGEEDGIEAKHDAKLFSTPEDGLATAAKLGLGERGRYMVAATFGNVHGVYKPGNVVLTPSILLDIQTAVGAKYGKSSHEKTFTNISMGQGQEKLAINALQEAAKNGNWLMVQNVHLMTDWMREFERALEIAVEDPTTNADFRCFISSEPPGIPTMDIIPESILQNSIKVSNQAP